MITLGVDAGSVLCKVVLLRDRQVAAWRWAPTRGDMAAVLEPLVAGVLEEAGVARADVVALGATGRFRQAVTGADLQEGDLACVAWAAREVLPQVEQVLEVGGQSITAMTLDAEGEVADFVRNDKCASGSGRFLEVMAEALGTGVEGLDSAARTAPRAAPVSDQCGVFVESEVVSLLNAGEPPGNIAAGLCEAVARIVAAQARRLGKARTFTVTGGVGRLSTVTSRVAEYLEAELQPFPGDPGLAAAMGAALIAEDEL